MLGLDLAHKRPWDPKACTRANTVHIDSVQIPSYSWTSRGGTIRSCVSRML